MKKKKSLLLFLAATSASFVQAALPVHTSFAAGIENVQEKGHTFVKGRVIDSEGNPLVGVTGRSKAQAMALSQMLMVTTYWNFHLWRILKLYFPALVTNRRVLNFVA